MTEEIIKVVDTVSEAKDLEREVIFEAIENAIASATKKKYTENMDVRVIIDRNTGEYKTYRQWMVFEDESRELEEPDYELASKEMLDSRWAKQTPNRAERMSDRMAEIATKHFG